ncbi:hypothetical protein Vi05172_g2593 [Venturia inaequalis]|nr:hypothetical protein Vi05172_g2593 [Venturia inaequalis]
MPDEDRLLNDITHWLEERKLLLDVDVNMLTKGLTP